MTFDHHDLGACIHFDMPPIDFLGDAIAPCVRDAFNSVDWPAAYAAAMADPLPRTDRTRVLDMFPRRPGVRAALGRIAAESFGNFFDRFTQGGEKNVR